MKANEIINDIKSQFTGDDEHDRMIILDSIKKYAEDDNAHEVVHELSKMLYDYLTPEQKKGFEKALKKDIPELRLVDDVYDDLNNQRFEEAFQKLDEYMKNEPKKFVDDEKTEYHILTNDMEEFLFEKYIIPEKEVKFVPREYPLLDLNFLYAYLLVEREEFDLAEKYLKIALGYNPVSTQVIFELVDLYKRKADWKNMKEYIQMAFNYSYIPEDLAKAYRHFGFYYTENGNAELAVALYLYSLKYDNNELAHHELEYLNQLGQNINITPEEAQKLLRDNDIPLVANHDIVKEYRSRGDKFAEEEELEKSLQMYAFAYMLDDSIENQMRYKIAEAALNGGGPVNITL